MYNVNPFSVTMLVVAGASLVSTVQAHAQPLFAAAASIESTVANADLVVIGRLVVIGDLVDDDACNATIAVEETLKEDIFAIEPLRRLRVHIPSPASVLADWRERSCRLLVAMGEGGQDAITVIELTPGSLEVLTADFTLLRDPTDVIRAAKGTVRRMPAAVRRIHTVELEVPRETVAGTNWDALYESGGHLKLIVPVDDRLEGRALEYIRSEDQRRREEGVRALRYFKSDENIARARTLLGDPAVSFLSHVQGDEGVEVRIYVVRREAYRTLKSWGVDVEKPVIREEVRK